MYSEVVSNANFINWFDYVIFHILKMTLYFYHIKSKKFWKSKSYTCIMHTLNKKNPTITFKVKFIRRFMYNSDKKRQWILFLCACKIYFGWTRRVVPASMSGPVHGTVFNSSSIIRFSFNPVDITGCSTIRDSHHISFSLNIT